MLHTRPTLQAVFFMSRSIDAFRDSFVHCYIDAAENRPSTASQISETCEHARIYKSEVDLVLNVCDGSICE